VILLIKHRQRSSPIEYVTFGSCMGAPSDPGEAIAAQTARGTGVRQSGRMRAEVWLLFHAQPSRPVADDSNQPLAS